MGYNVHQDRRKRKEHRLSVSCALCAMDEKYWFYCTYVHKITGTAIQKGNFFHNHWHDKNKINTTKCFGIQFF